MATEPTTVRRTSLAAIVFNTVALILAIVLIVAISTLLYDRFAVPRAIVAPSALPTAIVRQQAPAYQPQPAEPAINPADAIANYNATAEAAYRAAIAPVLENVDTTNDAAPLQYVSKPADERQPSGENVPTAEPIAPAESNDQFGSRPVEPINIQKSHTCLHGQVWTERGCKNPTPVQP